MATGVQQYFVEATRTPKGFINPIRTFGAVLPDDGIDRARIHTEILVAQMERAGVKYLKDAKK